MSAVPRGGQGVGGSRSVDRLDKSSEAEESCLGDQQQPVFDISLGKGEESREPCFGTSAEANKGGLARAVGVPAGVG
jgi:hypothetical protein